jgi:PKD repeat protein
MKKTILLSVFVAGLIFFGVPFCPKVFAVETDLIISEIMYDLPGGDSGHEWIEIYNGGVEEIIVTPGSGGQAWRFFDGSNHTLNLTQGTTTVAAQEFFVLAADADQFLIDYPEFSGTVFDTVMSLVNSSSSIALSFDGGDNYPVEASYDSVWGANGTGFSLEKINLTQDSSQENWQESSIENGTPGQANSDGQVQEEVLVPQAIISCPESLLVEEEGFFDASQSTDPQNLSLTFLWDFLDGTTATSSQAYHIWTEVNNYNVSLLVSNGELEGTATCLVEVLAEDEEIEEDEDDPGGGGTPPPPLNPWDDIIISEFLPNPAGSDNNEWIELFNKGEETIDLGGFKLQDNSARIFTIAEDENLNIAAQEYLILDKSFTGISLNNTGGDAVKLYDPEEELLEIIEYSGVALEDKSYARENMNLDNFLWTSALTPGEDNEFIANLSPQAKIDLLSKDLVVGEKIILSAEDSSDPEESDLEYVWDFGDETTGDEAKENHIYQAAGNYLVKLKVTDSEGEEDEVSLLINILELELDLDIQDVQPIDFDLSDLIISEFIPNPVGSDDYEWIELQNKSNKNIDLLAWHLDDQDGGSRPYVFSTSTLILSGGFLIVSREESGLTLNNSNDQVRLLTPLQEVWQEIDYEKIPEGQSMAWDDSNNEWFISQEPTAGLFNYAINSAPIIYGPGQLMDLEKKQSIVLQGLALHDVASSTRSLYLADWDQEEIYFDQVAEIYFHKKDFPSIKEGDLVEVSGQITKLEDLPRITIKDVNNIFVIDFNLNLNKPELITTDDLSEDFLGDFVYVKGMVTKKSGKSIYLSSDIEEDWQLRVYTKFSTKDLGIKKGVEIVVAGILSETDSGFKLVPFGLADISVSTAVTAAIHSESDREQIISNEIYQGEENDRVGQVKNILILILVGSVILLAAYFLKKKYKA